MGYVSCELGIAPERLEDFRKRHADEAAAEPVESASRTLTRNDVEPLDEATYGREFAENLGERLVTEWEYCDEKGQRWYEVRLRVVHACTLYTFTLASDEAHFAAYKLDFDEMFASARFSPPHTGLQRLDGGYWMQRQFRFAMKLPADWKPAFGPSDKALFFATGATHDLFTDHLLVLASRAKPLDLKALQSSLRAEIMRTDPQAQVTCELVEQGAVTALETVIQTRRDDVDVTILERRFGSDLRNYEVKFTCERGEFERLRDRLRKSLDSFVEVAEDGTPGGT